MSWLVALVLAIAVATARRPRSPVVFRRGRRRTREDVPVLIDGLAAALAAGLSLPGAFAAVAPTLHGALSTAVRRVSAALTLDASISTALEPLRADVPDEDVAPLAVVLTTFARTGGGVAESLERVASLLRGRIALDEERRALTAQSRASALVLVALAPLGAAFLSIAMPDYAATVFQDGALLIVLALAFEAAGAAWLWWIVRGRERGDDLATFLEAVVIGLDAGLTFERALDALVRRAPRLARLADVRRMLADLALGAPLPAALAAFAVTPEERRVAALVAASARFGSPLAHVLVVQADALRTSERHRAQTEARRLPILMLFPLACCILPALLLVFLGPPLLSLLR